MKQTKLRWRPSESATLNAGRVLPKLMRDYFKAGRKLDQDSSAKDMHRFRLKTKHLRYTLEAFAPLLGKGFDEMMQSLRPIQNALGDLNDCTVLLTEMRQKLPRETRSYTEKRQEEKREEFLRYWREEFDAADAHKKWEQFLTPSAPKRAARKAPAQK